MPTRTLGFDETVVVTDLHRTGDPNELAVVSKFDAHDVVSSVRWSPDESQMSWTTDGGDFQISDARARTPQLKVPLDTYLVRVCAVVWMRYVREDD